MSVRHLGSVTLFIVIACLFVCDVLCLPNPNGAISNEVSITNSEPKLNEQKSSEYTSLWNVKGSEESIRAIQAKLMRDYMNLSVNPCDDFYEYACGNWERVNPIPKDKSEYSVFTLLNNNIQNELREVLSQPLSSPSHSNQELGAEDKARVYFASCIDQDAINRRGVDPLLYFIDELGGWPVLDDNWSEQGFDWLRIAVKASLFGVSCVLSSDVDKDFKNSSQYSIYMDEPSMGLSNRDDYLNAENVDHLDAYRNLIVTILRLLDVDPEKAEDAAKEIVEFEVQLANITTDPHGRIDILELYRPITIAGLYEKYANIDWLTYLSGAQETDLHPNQTVIMLADNYYGNLSLILKEADSRVLANYMVWRCINPFLNDLDENVRAAVQTFKEALTGQKEPLARWKDCIRVLNSQMGMATGAMFARGYFDEDSKSETIRLLGEVKEAFREALSELTWIDENTKDLAQHKANETKLAIGYPDFILNPTELNKFYSDLQIVPGKKFENNLNLEKYTSRKNRKRIQDSIVDKELWPSTPAVVNAFFEQTNNRIVIPVGILQPPMFHKHFPKALTHGVMGVFVGHELTHGFDDIGRDFDDAGNLVQWWSPEAIKGFQERETCFIEQYGKFSVHGKFLQGTLSKGENIADNGGIRQAFSVYRKWQKDNAKSERDSSEAMPGLNLTNDQLFFVAFAQSWCDAIRPEAIENRIQTNNHCPGKFRVIGALANFDEFSSAFECPVGSVMNPEKKCRLW